MELSDLWLKMAKNETLTPQELDYLRIQGKNTQQNNAQTAGNTSADGKATFITPYIENPRWKNALNSTVFDLSLSVTTATDMRLGVSQSQINSESSIFSLMSTASTGIRVSTLNNFMVSGIVTFPSNSTGYRKVDLISKKSDGSTGSTVGLVAITAINGADTTLPFAYLYDRIRVDRYNNFKLEYIEISVYQNSGSSLDVVGQVGLMEV